MAHGFSLIELMITVAILAVLAALSFPSYQWYVSTSQAAAGLAEISGIRSRYEIHLGEGVAAAAPDTILPTNVHSTPRCTLSLSGTAHGQSIRCVLKGNEKVSGHFVQWRRLANDRWVCETSLSPRIAPQPCTLI